MVGPFPLLGNVARGISQFWYKYWVGLTGFCLSSSSLLQQLHISPLLPPTFVLPAVMSRYLAFVLLALSACSALAAPAELPTMPSVTVPNAAPATGPVTQPLVGSRSIDKAYSSNTLLKRDWQYPTSTKDCRSSEGPDHSTTPYTHDGQEYSKECLSRLALSVPSEKRESCHTTGQGYDEECLFKKAFDEDWKFDMEKAKVEELAYRSAHPDVASSDAWSKQFPVKILDCVAVGVSLGEKVGKGKAGMGGKKGMTKGSAATSASDPFFTTPDGLVLEIECLLRLVLAIGIKLDGETCPAETKAVHSTGNRPFTHLTRPHGRSTTELATRQLGDISVFLALDLGCLFALILELLEVLGLEAILANGDPLGVFIAGLLDEVLVALGSLLGLI